MRFLDGLFNRLFGRKKAEKALPPHVDGPESAPPLRQYEVFRLPTLPPGAADEAALSVTHIGMYPWIAPCPHPDGPRAYTFTIRDLAFRAADIAGARCAPCMQSLFERSALTCAACGGPIVPVDHLAVAWIGAPQPFTHSQCAENEDLLCGVLSFGKVLTIHELDASLPPGTATMAQEKFRLHVERGREASQGPEADATDPTLAVTLEPDEDGTDPGDGNGSGGSNAN